MMRLLRYILPLLLILLSGISLCYSSSTFNKSLCLKELASQGISVKQLELNHASGLSLYSNKNKDFFLVNILRPWKGSSSVYRYILSDKKIKNGICKNYIFIRTPVKRIVSLSTTNLSSLSLINYLDNVVGFSGTKYVNTPKAVTLVRKGVIRELGYPVSHERLISLRPDVILSYVVSSPVVEGIDKQMKLGLPVLVIAEHAESNPLARAEWIKVYGALAGKFKESSKLYNDIKNNYDALKSKVISSVKVKPVVIIGKMTNGNWVAPGGNSDLAQIIRDAGGKYFFDNYKQYAPLSINYEVIIKSSSGIDLWLPHEHYWNSKRDILNTDKRYSLLSFYKNKSIYNNNNLINKSGGSDFWETATIRPDLLLNDLVNILHPNINSNNNLTWYKKLQK